MHNEDENLEDDEDQEKGLYIKSSVLGLQNLLSSGTKPQTETMSYSVA